MYVCMKYASDGFLLADSVYFLPVGRYRWNLPVKHWGDYVEVCDQFPLDFSTGCETLG